MTTSTYTLVANTPQVALTGRYTVRQVVFNATGAGVLSVYDASTTTLTQSNAAYSNYVQDCSYTRTVTGVRDLACNSNDYEYDGVSNTPNTVAADATYALPAKMALGVPGAGQTTVDAQAVFTRGVVLNSTVGGTAQVTYDLAF
jgi:hypothetical protein